MCACPCLHMCRGSCWRSWNCNYTVADNHLWSWDWNLGLLKEQCVYALSCWAISSAEHTLLTTESDLSSMFHFFTSTNHHSKFIVHTCLGSYCTEHLCGSGPLVGIPVTPTWTTSVLAGLASADWPLGCLLILCPLFQPFAWQLHPYHDFYSVKL